MKLPIRMVASDMDGTLLDNDKKISAGNLAALEELKAAGIPLVICTGRHPVNARFVLNAHGLEYPVIGLNGSLVFDSGARVLGAHPFDASAFGEVIGLLEKNRMDYLVFTAGDIVLREQIEGTYTGGTPLSYLHEIATGHCKTGKSAYEAALKGEVYKIAAFNRLCPALVEKTRAGLSGVGAVSVSRSADVNVEIMPAGVDKGSGIREYAALVGIPPGEVLSLGDEENDLPMLRSTGYSIAVANASETVKQAVKYLTGSNEDDGVAKALRKYVLSKE